MVLVSHRGNLTGRKPSRENSPDYILEAINAGFNVEVDVWLQSGKLQLGHDFPQQEVNLQFLMNDKIWCHAKNIEALNYLRSYNMIHCFWHQNDDYTITSKGYIWAFSGRIPFGAIAVMPENYHNLDLSFAIGVCSDIVAKYKEK